MYFPVFADLSGRKIIVIGGGKIALRRVRTLLPFAPVITVIAPRAEEGIRELCSARKIEWIERAYREGDEDGADIVLAATDCRELNRKIAESCREKRIPVNAADKKELCDFYFPGVIRYGDLVIAVGSGGKNHEKVKKMRQDIENWLKKPE